MTTEAAGPGLMQELDGIETLMSEACTRYGVPGASLAVRHGDELFECATGVVNRNTGVETTPDALFQIGSITKVFTTTLLMQLVDEGRLELDAPVRTYLPQFALAEPDRAARVTIRHLVTHTSGIEGDFFLDTGRGDDCVERYVLAMGALPGLHPLGEMWSYCNAGFVVAGRIIERLTGLTWDQALKQRLLEPAGISSMGTLPEEAILGRAAAGHMPNAQGEIQTAGTWALPRSNGPAGATPFATARDLLTFGWLHLDGGVAGNGSRLLSEESVSAMQGRHAALPGVGDIKHWGLGWMHFDWGPEAVIGHDGGTVGQSSFLRLVPRRRFGVALLTNGGNTQALYRKVVGETFTRVAHIEMPPLPAAGDGAEIDLTRFEGTYEKLSARLEIRQDEGQLVATATQLGFITSPPQVQDLAPIDSTNLLGTARGTRFQGVLTFLGPRDEGGFDYVRAGSRLHRRVS
ncbi:MAG TPA: serine hydrolase domain-containing protein [Gemmatimonadales bacterium]|nr:serine hydrolase domain-containing protein [Gemmatimonadales bacterium]